MRRTLEDAEAGYVARLADGYRLDLGGGWLDVGGFRSLRAVAQKRLGRGDLRGASDALGQALRLWRGAPLQGVVSGRVECLARSLLDERLEVIDLWARVELDLGRHLHVTHLLREVCLENPFVEKFHLYLARSLYQSDRVAEALETLRATRRHFVEQLGVEPSARLSSMERQILKGAM